MTGRGPKAWREIARYMQTYNVIRASSIIRWDTRSGGVAAAIVVAAVLAFLWESWAGVSPVDDAFISYRYARNLVEGHGLVYNVGEYVEGFTNLLWTLLVAGGLALGFEAKSVGHALGLASGVAVLLGTMAYATIGLERSRVWVAAFAPWLVLSIAGFPIWSTSGMETPLFVAAVIGALAAAARGRIGWATVAAIAATMTRPDGVLVAAVVFGFHLLSHRHDGMRVFGWPIVYLLTLGLITGFRIAYYGSPVPNTFYAKVGGVPFPWGVRYVLDFLRSGAAFLLLPAAFGAVRERQFLPGAVYTGLVTAYLLWVGGDAFPHSRFLLPVLPCLAALAARGAASAYRSNRHLGIALAVLVAVAMCRFVFGSLPQWIGVGMAVVVCGWVAAIHPALSRGLATAGLTVALLSATGIAAGVAGSLGHSKRLADIAKAHRSAKGFETAGRHKAVNLATEATPTTLVAAGAIGSIGFYSELPILDLFGIVDPVIARSYARADAGAGLALPGHSRSNADYVLRRKPDFILLPRSPNNLLPANRALHRHPDFAAWYDYDPRIPAYRRRASVR